MKTLHLGSAGTEVEQLQRALATAGFDPGGIDGSFGLATKAALIAFQIKHGLGADGSVDSATAAALNISDVTKPSDKQVNSGIAAVPVEVVLKMFPDTPVHNIEANLPIVLNALVDAGVADQRMILMALATIRAEVGCFAPISEFQSRFNTSPGGHPYDLYDNRAELGNQGPPDGANFRGRGFIQLTGRKNYECYGQAIGLGNQLVENPDLACDPVIAAKLMASFIKTNATRIKAALAMNDVAQARKCVNGGSHGLAEFATAYTTGAGLIPEDINIGPSPSTALA
ncbi:MAG: peptidoglycan-binding protein [Bryobacteraceae bacterium]